MVVAVSVAEEFFRAVLQGTPPGTVYALIALGFVLTYKTSGVFNLAFGAQAYVSAALYFKLHVEDGWHQVPALIVSVFLLAPAVGLVLERLIFRHLRTASSVAKLVVAIGLTVAIPELFKVLADFNSVAGQTPEGIFPDGRSVYYDPFGVYRFNRNEITQMGVALVGTLVLGALFRFTPIGLRMRAVVESPRMTELNGIDADRVSAFAWALSSLFAGMAGVLIAPRFNTLVAPDFFSLIVVAIAAAAVGKLVSLPRALIGGLGLGILTALLNTYLPKWTEDLSWLEVIKENLTPSVPFVALFGVLVFWPAIRRARDAVDPLSGVDPPPPALAAAERSPELTRISRIFGVVFIAALLLWLLTNADTFYLFLFTRAAVMAVILLSVTVFTGMAGQISLCQATFAAIGGFTAYQLAANHDISVLGGMLVGALIAAAAGALLSLPVLRLGGIWLALATLAFAFFFDAVMVKFSWVGAQSSLQGARVPRPTLGPIDFTHSTINGDRWYLGFCIVVLTVCSLLVLAVREGTVGRTLRALRGSELAAQSIGISPSRARVTAFALSAALAGVGGALSAMHQENVNYAGNFVPFQGLFWLVLAVTMSVRTVEGAIQAGAAFVLFPELVLKKFIPWLTDVIPLVPEVHPNPALQFVLFGLAAISFAKHPEGLLEHGKRRSLAKQQARLDRRRARRLPVSPEGATV